MYYISHGEQQKQEQSCGREEEEESGEKFPVCKIKVNFYEMLFDVFIFNGCE